MTIYISQMNIKINEKKKDEDVYKVVVAHSTVRKKM